MRAHGDLLVLEIEDVLAISEAATKDAPIIRDRGLLLSAIDRPLAAMFGVEAYPTLMEKAGALLHSLARNHALVDGNKRTAVATALVFTEINGSVIEAPDQGDLVDLVLAVAQDQMDVPLIASTLAVWVV